MTDRDRGMNRAVEYLRTQGLVVLDRDWAGTGGTLPLVAANRHGRTLVVMEVRVVSRMASLPVVSIPERLTGRLRRLAVQWMSAHGQRFERVRADLVVVSRDGSGQLILEHIEGSS